MTGPAVSVLLTCYNRGRFLPHAVRSVFTQTMTDWELIILDDDSDDPGVISYLAEIWHHPQVIVYKSTVPEGGRADLTRYAVQANTGLKLAAGRYITYLCDDDWYAPNRLEVMAGMLDADPSLGVVYSHQAVTDETGNITGHRVYGPVLNDAYCRVNMNSVMHTAEAGRKAGGWATSAEYWRIADAVFWRRLHAAGYAFHLAPGGEPLDFHREHPGNCNEIGGPY